MGWEYGQKIFISFGSSSNLEQVVNILVLYSKRLVHASIGTHEAST